MASASLLAAEGESIVLCPTARFAALESRRRALQSNAGAIAWLTPTVLSFSAWLDALAEAYFLTADDDRTLINTVQSEYIWQSLVDDDVFVGQPSVAGLAMDAWRRLHEYCLDMPAQWLPGYCSTDALAFAAWSRRYEDHCAERNWLDPWMFAAELPGLVAKGLIALPEQISCVGFEQPRPPLQQALLQACSDAGVRVEGLRQEQKPESECTLTSVLSCVDPELEIFAAATWARSMLDGQDFAKVNQSNNTDQSEYIEAEHSESKATGLARIAIVVPDLAARLDGVERIFREVFDAPGFALADESARPWHISLGRPLVQSPLVADALALLELRPGALTIEQAGQLLRSPFLTGYDEEHAARADVLNALHDRAPYRVSVQELQREALRNGAGAFASNLDRWLSQVEQRPGDAWPSQWVAAFTRQLAALGFGRGRSLDSIEYQCLQRWHALLEAVSGMDPVFNKPIDRSNTLRILRQHCGGAVFREQNTGALIDVLGVEEAIGMQFDAVWLTSLDAETWPGQPARDPLIPGPVQQSVPGATQSGSLSRAKLQLNLLASLAVDARGSYCPVNEEVSRELTALVRAESILVQQEPALPEAAPVALLADDARAPKVRTSADSPEQAGGTGVLRNMAQCPFRAFAVHRLGARDIRPAKPGLSPLHRGNAVHKALEVFWRQVISHDALTRLSQAERATEIGRAVQAAIAHGNRHFQFTIAGPEQDGETERLQYLLEHWLEVERRREPFSVIGFEQPVELALGPLRFNGSVDRIDRLSDGSLLIIDYKSHAPSVQEWLSELEDEEHRIREPQLPAYVLNLSEQPMAVAFAQVKPEELGFAGVSADEINIAGIRAVAKTHSKYKNIDDWAALTGLWQRGLLKLTENYAAGDAVVDPLKKACDYCHLQAVCRIDERLPVNVFDDEQSEGGGYPDD
ncbi:MAG: PD-(D/E)XK nuclease family protein [Pseudomonadaceae bacterium]|nr:PD-(D/E)XK nuclease family protein [Pseudomonadaceae bacterium]